MPWKLKGENADVNLRTRKRGRERRVSKDSLKSHARATAGQNKQIASVKVCSQRA